MLALYLNLIITSLSDAPVRSALLVLFIIALEGICGDEARMIIFSHHLCLMIHSTKSFFHSHSLCYIHTEAFFIYLFLTVTWGWGSRITGAVMKSVERIPLVILHITLAQKLLFFSTLQGGRSAGSIAVVFAFFLTAWTFFSLYLPSSPDWEQKLFNYSGRFNQAHANLNWFWL